MQSARELRSRIRSVASTSQITRAMSLVAAVRLRRAQSRMQSAEQYWRRLSSALARSTAEYRWSHPLLERRDERKRTIVVFGSDRGLCGSFNRDILSAVSRAVGQVPAGVEVGLVPVGDRITSVLRSSGIAPATIEHRLTVRGFLDPGPFPGDLLSDWFLSGLTDRIDLLAARPSKLSPRGICIDTVIPVEAGSGVLLSGDCIFEPSIPEILRALVPACFRAGLAFAAAGSETAEQTARLTAMTAATRNADDMLAGLRLASNKLRQAMVTRELTEIVAGGA
jgi:F-type H+-transporting ATPase subunit gamma